MWVISMENIIKLFGAVGILGIICVGFVALLYPIMFEIKFKEHCGKSGISYFWAIVQLIGVLGTLSYVRDTSSDSFTEALGFTVIIFIVAMIRNYKRVKSMGHAKKVRWSAVLAQATAPASIIVIMLLVSSVLNKITDEENVT